MMNLRENEIIIIIIIIIINLDNFFSFGGRR